jgi:hypothetical protein
MSGSRRRGRQKGGSGCALRDARPQLARQSSAGGQQKLLPHLPLNLHFQAAGLGWAGKQMPPPAGAGGTGSKAGL